MKAEGGEGGASVSEGFDARSAAATLQEYMEENPTFASSAFLWVASGAVLLFVALVTLVFSEVRVVLVVRDRDFRKDMATGGYMDETDKLVELEKKETDTVAARPYLTVGSMIVQFGAIVCFLKPFCDVLDVIGLPSSNCFLTVVFGSFVGAITLTTFIMGLCWSCTRGWAALVLLLISVTGNLMCPTGSPFLVVVWLLLGGGAFFYYFLWLPEQDEVPEWCQTIGPIRPSMDPEEWKKAAQGATNAGLADIQTIPGMSGLVGSPKEAEAKPMRATATV